MKNYCNKRTPKQQQIQQLSKKRNSDESESIAFPPVSVEYENDTYNTYAQGGAYTQESGYIKEILGKKKELYSIPTKKDTEIFFDNMHGQFDFLSIPKEKNALSIKSMSSFLDRYIGKLICLDLWTVESGREELCGTLIETGKSFIVINPHETDTITMIDLRSIRYVSIYCR